MSFQEFYCDASGANGASNMNAGDKTTPPTTTTGGAYTQGGGAGGGATDRYVATGGAPFSGVSAGDYVSIYTDGATTPAYIARITAVNSSTSIDVDSTKLAGARQTTAASGISATVGGPWLGPNAAISHPFGFITNTVTDGSGNYPRVNFKAGTNYAITAAMTHNKAGPTYFQGYTGSLGDGGKAVIDGGTSGASYTLLTVSAVQNYLRDLVLQNNGATLTANALVVSSNACTLERVAVNSTRGFGISYGAQGLMLECEAYSCNQANTASKGGIAFAASGVTAKRCASHDNAGGNSSGFVLSTGTANQVLEDCIADTNGAAGVLINNSNNTVLLSGLDAYGNTTAGVLVSGNNVTLLAENCIFANNGTFGVNSSGTGSIVRLSNCAFRSNTSGQTSGAVDATGSITLSADPMNDAANGDFSLNSAAGGGASCRNGGRGNFTQISGDGYTKTTTAFPDVGAVQHQDAGSSAGLMRVGGMLGGCNG